MKRTQQTVKKRQNCGQMQSKFPALLVKQGWWHRRAVQHHYHLLVEASRAAGCTSVSPNCKLACPEDRQPRCEARGTSSYAGHGALGTSPSQQSCATHYRGSPLPLPQLLPHSTSTARNSPVTPVFPSGSSGSNKSIFSIQRSQLKASMLVATGLGWGQSWSSGLFFLSLS